MLFGSLQYVAIENIFSRASQQRWATRSPICFHGHHHRDQALKRNSLRRLEVKKIVLAQQESFSFENRVYFLDVHPPLPLWTSVSIEIDIRGEMISIDPGTSWNPREYGSDDLQYLPLFPCALLLGIFKESWCAAGRPKLLIFVCPQATLINQRR